MSSVIKIASFMCWKWGYGAGDMAGTIRAQYPTTIRAILVPCAGRVGSELIMRAIGQGADGILIVGWHPGECDYEIGNKLAYREVEYINQILNVLGLSDKRVKMEYCSSAEGQKFQQVAINFDKLIRNLGKNPLNKKSSDKNE